MVLIATVLALESTLPLTEMIIKVIFSGVKAAGA
jgi:hypothetical protein